MVSNKEGGENDLIHHVAQEGFLDVITAGPVPPNPSELLLSEKLDSLMARLREKYDYVIVDTAPVERVSDTFSLTRFVDATLYVCRLIIRIKIVYSMSRIL